MSRGKKAITFTVATSTSPANTSGGTDKERLHLSPAEFGQQLSLLAAETKDIARMARKIGASKGKPVSLEGGETFTAKKLNALITEHNRTLKTLKKNYTARGYRKKHARKTGASKKGEGFSKGSFLRQPLLDFLRSADFGTVNGSAGGGQAISTLIAPLLDAGLLSRSILTVLLTINAFANGHRFVSDGKKYYRAGPNMEQHLGSYLTEIESRDKALPDSALIDKKGNKKLRFDRNKFVYNRFASISSPGLFEKGELDQQRRDYLDNQQVKDLLQNVQTAVSATLKIWNPKK